MDDDLATPARAATGPTAREVFLSWERYRLVYNLVLAAVAVLSLAIDGRLELLGDGGFWWHLVMRAVGANLCFGVGPWLEGWLRLAGEDGPTVRRVLFVLGTGLAALLTVGSVWTYGRPMWD